MSSDRTSGGAPPQMKTFILVWFGQVVSLLGSGLGSFALGVWVYQQTGSVTRFALIAFFGSLPGLLLSPVAGALVDRWDRKRTMMLADFGAGLCTLTMAALLYFGLLEIWHIYLLVAAITTCGAFQRPAFTAATTLIVPAEQLGRASGMAQIGGALSEVLSPALAGALVLAIGLQGVMVIDFSTFLFAVATLALVRVPRPPAAAVREGRSSLAGEIKEAWAFVAARPGLRGLLVFYAAANLALAMVLVLLTPMLLSFASPAVAGTVLSIGSVGMLAGAVAMAAWGGPRRRVDAILLLVLLQGLLLIVGGARPSAPLIAAAAFAFLVCNAIINGSDQVIWQRKVPPELQGRIFSLQRMIAGSSLPVAFLVAGPLADRVFEPLLAPGGALAGSAGRLIGTGPGRGIGLLFIVLGIALALTAAVAALNPRLRRVESELPDALPADSAPAPAAAALPESA